jgi:hypothetical protein
MSTFIFKILENKILIDLDLLQEQLWNKIGNLSILLLIFTTKQEKVVSLKTINLYTTSSTKTTESYSLHCLLILSFSFTSYFVVKDLLPLHLDWINLVIFPPKLYISQYWMLQAHKKGIDVYISRVYGHLEL